MGVPRSAKYLKFLRTLPCAACGRVGRSQASHGAVAGKGLKGSDYDAIPLCATCHTDGDFSWHKVGEKEFAEFWDLDLDLIRAANLERFKRSTESKISSGASRRWPRVFGESRD